MDKNVNIELYDFMDRSQCEIIKVQGNLKFYIRIAFDNLTEFVEIIGRGHFGGTAQEVHMFDDHIVFDLNDLFEHNDMKISDYRRCFENYKEFEAEIREWEG